MYAIAGFPSDLGLKPHGVRDAPRVLRPLLLQKLDAYDAGDVTVAPYDPRRADVSSVLNASGLREASLLLSERVAQIVRDGNTPIVLAGDCSVILGCLHGARKALSDRVGLLFLDGHVDFYQPEASPTGEAADMDLALATGRGPEPLASLGGLRDEDVVAIGARDREERERAGSQDIRETAITLLELDDVRTLGLDAVRKRALTALPRAFWCHLDADVLDDAIMPAVDYRQPGGLQPAEVSALIEAAASRMAGLSVAIYNPELDPERVAARALVEVIANAFGVR